MTFICGEAEVPEELWSADIPPVVAGCGDRLLWGNNRPKG
jgi:hypothetical protein